LIKKNGRTKVAIVDAGFVGTTFAYSLLIRSLVSEIVLIDTDRDRAEGEAMDLSHGLPFLSKHLEVTPINFCVRENIAKKVNPSATIRKLNLFLEMFVKTFKMSILKFRFIMVSSAKKFF